MEQTNENILKLIGSAKRYLGYQKKYVKLDLAEKLTLLLTALVLGAVIFVIGLIAVIFLALTLAAALRTWTGSACAAYFIVAILFILLCLLIYVMRNKWIVSPLSKFFSHLLLSQDESRPRQTYGAENQSNEVFDQSNEP